MRDPILFCKNCGWTGRGNPNCQECPTCGKYEDMINATREVVALSSVAGLPSADNWAVRAVARVERRERQAAFSSESRRTADPTPRG